MALVLAIAALATSFPVAAPAQPASLRSADTTDPAAEALRRARAVHDAWMARRNPDTCLFPQSLKRPEWNALNVAADFFCFQYAIAFETDAPSLPALRGTLARERALNGAGLCDSYNAATGASLRRNTGRKLFGTTEYLKDGLISLYERTGDKAVRVRMIEVADAILAASTLESKYGPIPSRDSEVNGNVLQAFSRLYFITGDQRYADQVGRLADAVVLQMFPATGGLPVHKFDYSAGRPTGRPSDAHIHLRDHGNETAVGLSEAFALAVTLGGWGGARPGGDPIWQARADRWAEPLARMYETLLNKGRNADGLLVNRIVPADSATADPAAAQPCDNWGYLLCGAILFTQAAERHSDIPRERCDAILASVDSIARAVARRHDIVWEPHPGFPGPAGHPDGLADSIESGLYIAFHRPALRAELLAWADIEIARVFVLQRPDGFVTNDYLDGNVIRTCLLYADARRAQPVHAAHAGGAGVLRWRDRMKLPWDWPRINSWPQWGVGGEVDAEESDERPTPTGAP